MYSFSRKISCIFVLLFFSFISLHAQQETGSLRGFVHASSSGEPLMFINLYLDETNQGSSSDENGYFVFSKVPVGTYHMRVFGIGYTEKRVKITIKKGEVVSEKIFLDASAKELQEVQIQGERKKGRTESQVSIEKISPREMKQLPSIGGQADLAQYMQVLPGVVFTGDQGGQLYIRGGSAIQNKVLLDGMTIHNPFHSIGLFSVFETDLIRTADVYTGGFGAEYGGRISSVMDIKTRDGNQKQHKGKASVSTFGAQLLLEGPLMKYRDSTQTALTYILTAKNSYLSRSSDIFYRYMESSLPYDFLDVYGKVTFSSEHGTKMSLFGFNFRDDVRSYQSLSDFNWSNWGVGGNFLLIPGSSVALIEGFFSYSNYEVSMDGLSSQENAQEVLSRKSQIGGFDGGLQVVNFFGQDRLQYGLHLQGHTISNQIFPLNREYAYSTELGAFMKYKGIVGKLLYEPSLRLNYYASLGDFSPEPRLSLKLNLTKNFRLKSAMGLYSQAIIDTKSDKDIVNLFTGYLYGSPNLNRSRYFLGEEKTSYMQKAIHFICGAEVDLSHQWSLNLEGYYKKMDQLMTLNRERIYDDIEEHRPEGSDPQPDYLKKEFVLEKGEAYGGDVSVRFDNGRLYSWFVYSLGWVTRTGEKATYYPHYDRRHNINLLLSYQIGRSRQWEVSSRWNYGSGFPFIPTKGVYQSLPLQGGLDADYISDNGVLGIYYGDLNSRRLPTYHRLDISVKKRFEMKRSSLEVSLSVTNVYNRKNLFYYDRIKGKRVDQLPLMPSVGLIWTF